MAGIQFDEDVYVSGEGVVNADARLPGRMADAVTRADFFDVILDEDSRQAGALLPWLGSLVTDHTGPSAEAMDDEDLDADTGMPRAGSSGSINAIGERSHSSPSRMVPNLSSAGNPAKFESFLMELVDTERSYVRRLDTLYNRYAKPLRQSAKDREAAILPVYEAQRLFGNAGELLGANMAFLQDMEERLEAGGSSSGSWDALKASIGEIAHRNVSAASRSRERHSAHSVPSPR